MTLGSTDEQIDRELRRRQLAKRLTAHQARTQTICAMTTLTRHQLTTLRRRWNVPQRERYRGPAPTSFTAFTKTLRGQTEGAALYALCRIVGALADGRATAGGKQFASVEAGERLCDVVEICRVCFPRLKVDFEQIKMIATGVMIGDRVSITDCTNCNALILTERLSSRRRLCAHCRHTPQMLAERVGADSENEPEDGTSRSGDIQRSLF